MSFNVTPDFLDAFHRIGAKLAYDPINGLFHHKFRLGQTRGDNIFNAKFGGRRAGSVDTSTGYRVICVDGERWYEHRLAFLLMTGSMPPFVDHLNGVRDDNRWANLREATKQVNCRNAALPRHNTSGHVGVAWVGRLAKWRAEISLNNKTIVLGHFSELANALAARDAANKANGFSERHGSR